MVSAICPNCRLLLVEADSAYLADLGAAVNEAVALGASVVSNSWGADEYSDEVTDNALYFDHPGIPIVASSGDYGYERLFPAASPDVVAVGGTTLYQSTAVGTRDATESAWIDSGSGCSAYMPKPSWQHDTGCSRRSIADVSAVADPSTGVWVWDTFPPAAAGGSSAGQVFRRRSLPPSTRSPATLPALNRDAVHAVRRPDELQRRGLGQPGRCGTYLCGAGPGYDGPTGLGTPNGLKAFLLSSAPPAPPTVSFSAPTSGATLFGTTPVQVSASASAGVANVTLAVDGTLSNTLTAAPWTFNLDTTRLANGTHTLSATVYDAAGKTAGAQMSVNVQNVPPDTKPPSTPSGVKAAVAGTTQVAIYWSPSTDNVGVAGYYVFRDGTQIARTALPNYFDIGLSPGTSHVYVVRAFDAGGNVSSGSSNLNAKTVALSTSSTGTVAGVVYSSAGRPLANVVVTLSGYGVTKTTKTGNTGVYKFTSLPAGTYTLTFATAGTTTAASPPGTTVTSMAGQTLVLVASS